MPVWVICGYPSRKLAALWEHRELASLKAQNPLSVLRNGSAVHTHGHGCLLAIAVSVLDGRHAFGIALPMLDRLPSQVVEELAHGSLADLERKHFSARASTVLLRRTTVELRGA